MAKRPSDPEWTVFITCVLSHLPMLLTIFYLFRRNYIFECCMGVFSLVVSFMYHTCECFDTTLFLSELRWHRLDNICAITSVGVTCVYLARIENQALMDYIKYVYFFVVMILQEGHPWDERYTAAPVALAVMFAIAAHIRDPRRRRGLVLRRLILAILLDGVAVFFFALGLNDQGDPYRIFHGLFHLFIAFGVFASWTAIRVQRPRKEDPDARSSARPYDTTAVVFNA